MDGRQQHQAACMQPARSVGAARVQCSLTAPKNQFLWSHTFADKVIYKYIDKIACLMRLSFSAK